MPSSALAKQPDNCRMSSSSALANQPGEAKILSSTIAQTFQLISSSSPSSGVQSNTAKVSSCSPICAGDQCTEHLLLCGRSDPPLQSSSGSSFPVSTEVHVLVQLLHVVFFCVTFCAALASCKLYKNS